MRPRDPRGSTEGRRTERAKDGAKHGAVALTRHASRRNTGHWWTQKGREEAMVMQADVSLDRRPTGHGLPEEEVEHRADVGEVRGVDRPTAASVDARTARSEGGP